MMKDGGGILIVIYNVRGRNAAGFTEGRNLTIEYRYADERYERLPLLAADLVGRRVAAIFSTGPHRIGSV